MTEAQARCLWDEASRLSAPAKIVEIGSFQGRSTIVLATAATEGIDVVAIDPHAGNDRGPQEFEGFAAAAADDHERFLANLAEAGVGERVQHLRMFSSAALAEVEGQIDLLYIDGAHRYGPALDDVRRWGARVRSGGTMLVHDSFSSVGVTGALLTALLRSERFTYERRHGSMAVYRCTPPSSRAVNAARQVAQLPWFVRNVAIKGLIVAHLGRLTPLLGHRSGDWPY